MKSVGLKGGAVSMPRKFFMASIFNINLKNDHNDLVY